MNKRVLIGCEYSGIVRDAFENAGWNAWSCDLLPTESAQTKASGKHIEGDVLRLFGKRYISPDYNDTTIDWHGFAMFGNVLMAKKDNVKEQVEISCSGTGCVTDKKPNINIKLERSSFPNGFNHEDYDIIGYSCKNEAVNSNYDIPRKWDLLIAHPPCTYLSYAYTGKERYSVERMQKKIEAYQFFLELWNAPVEHICIENPLGYAHAGLLPCTQIIEPYYFGNPYKKRTCLWLKNLPKLMYSEDTLFSKSTKVEPKKQLVKTKGSKMNAYGDSYCGKERSKFHKGIAHAMAEQWTEYILSLEI